MTASQVRGKRTTLPQERRSKYRAVKETVDGVTFHSKKEARRYRELKVRERAFEIRALRLQPRFPLTVQRAGELTILAGEIIGDYVADFEYEEWRVGGWMHVVEEVKGFKTPLYRWKVKHFLTQYPVDFREV